MSSFLKIITCLVFAMVLVTPLTLTLANIELTSALEENRLREKFPSPGSCELLLPERCFERIDSWFNDNYQPRDLLIKLKTQIDYSVFSTSDKVHIGSGERLYYRSTMDGSKVAIERIPQMDFDRLLTDLDALDTYLKDRGIQLVVLPIPLKDVIYPENLPLSSPNLPEDSRYQQLRRWLGMHESILTIDAYDHLTDRKKNARAFHKTDFHWNDPAGFLFAEKLVNTLWQHQSGESASLWAYPLTIEQKPFSGGQANFLPLLSAPQEQGLFLDVTWSYPKGIYVHNDPGGFWDYIYDGSGDERGRLGAAVIMGDSFYDAMSRSGIDSHFSSVHRSRVQPDRFAEVYANIPEGTDFFIFEFIEVQLFIYSLRGLSVPVNEQAPAAKEQELATP